MSDGIVRVSAYQPPAWLRNCHVQTILPNSPLRRRASVILRDEVLELPDGDFLRLEWLDGDGPIVVMLHGLEGSSQSRYARGVMTALRRTGYRVVLMSFRGCGGTPNRLDRSYHAGDTGDLGYLIRHLRETHKEPVLGALGYSLGGNALLKYLGESGLDGGLSTAIAVSVPFDLQDACAAMSIGAARFYQRLLLGRLKASTKRKFNGRPAPFDLRPGLAASDFEGFDGQVTAPLHGFADASDYYRKSSCRPFLKRIRVPTLIVHAADDPFMTRAAIPAASELSECVTLELSEHGGHVGFLAGRSPLNLQCWLEERIVQHFADTMKASGVSAAPPSPPSARSRSWRRKARPVREPGPAAGLRRD